MHELYKLGQDVYIQVGRHVDRDVHQIYKVLGEGNYELSRHGTVVKNEAGTASKIYLEEDLQSPVSFQPYCKIFPIFRAVLVLTPGISASCPTRQCT